MIKKKFFFKYKKECINPLIFRYLIYCFAASFWLKTMYFLFVLIFKVSKSYRKKSKIAKNNRKRAAIISHQKILIIAKKIESIDPNHYRIALGLRCKYRKMSSMWCDCRPCKKSAFFKRKDHHFLDLKRKGLHHILQQFLENKTLFTPKQGPLQAKSSS